MAKIFIDTDLILPPFCGSFFYINFLLVVPQIWLDALSQGIEPLEDSPIVFIDIEKFSKQAVV
jgi:hypothetical protein